MHHMVFAGACSVSLWRDGFTACHRVLVVSCVRMCFLSSWRKFHDDCRGLFMRTLRFQGFQGLKTIIFFPACRASLDIFTHMSVLRGFVRDLICVSVRTIPFPSDTFSITIFYRSFCRIWPTSIWLHFLCSLRHDVFSRE